MCFAALFQLVNSASTGANHTAVMVAQNILDADSSIKHVTLKPPPAVTTSASVQPVDVAVSQKMLEEATADNERISEVLDREKVVSYTPSSAQPY